MLTTRNSDNILELRPTISLPAMIPCISSVVLHTTNSMRKTMHHLAENDLRKRMLNSLRAKGTTGILAVPQKVLHH